MPVEGLASVFAFGKAMIPFRRVQYRPDGRIYIIERTYNVSMKNIPIQNSSIIEDDSISDNDLGWLYYFENDQLTPRPINTISIDKTTMTADGVDVATISNLPNPSRVKVNNQIITIEDGLLELTFDLPGTYKVQVDPFPTQFWEVEIVAV
jgi:hypothetical protein